MAIAEANHMHFIARNNCIWGIVSACALWPHSAAMFDYPSDCVRMWVNATVNSWLVKTNAMSQNCHSFYNLLTDNPVQTVFDEKRVWKQQTASHSAHMKQAFVFVSHFYTSGDRFWASRTPSKQKTMAINSLFSVVGEGFGDFAFWFKIQKISASKLLLYSI